MKFLQSSRIAAVASGYLLLMMICGGATCAGGRRSVLPEFNPPPVFTSGAPTLDELIEKTNRSLAVNSLSSNSLTILIPDTPTVSGNFRWERPNNFRLETKVFSRAFGVPLAAGSNSNMFWLQSSRPTPTIYYANHNEFENQHGPRHILPVSPLWLREAFGIVELDPRGRHEGPSIRADGKIEVITFIPSPRGDYRRKLTMTPTSGTIEETMLYDHTGKLIASAKMSAHQYYAGIDWSLPHKVQIQLMPDGEPMNFTVEVGYYQTNDQAPPNSFTFPDVTGYTPVDLVRVNEAIQNEAAGNQVQPMHSASFSGLSAPKTPTTTNPVFRTAATTNQSWKENLRQ